MFRWRDTLYKFIALSFIFPQNLVLDPLYFYEHSSPAVFAQKRLPISHISK